ncbi:phosphotransferase [Alphaproteobacteria bacterium]|nr:phosphotransferase [Alphaproteobacteria bacterium]
MIKIKRKNGGFTSLYKIEIKKYKKIIKIYNQTAFSSFFRTNLNKTKPFYKSLNNIGISPRYRVMSDHIIEIDEIENDIQLNKKELFFDKDKLKKFRDRVLLIQKIDKKTLKKDLTSEIKRYLIYTETPKIIRNNFKKLEKYINRYPQNKVCHGDIHFGNLLASKEKYYLLDWDYSLISCLGYDIAMFAYLEKLNQKQIEILSDTFKISISEIKHYLPICVLLDCLYQNILSKKINRKLIKEVSKFIEDTL